MTLMEALRSTNRVRLRMWPAGRYWEFNDDRTNFKVPGTEITRETLTLKQILRRSGSHLLSLVDSLLFSKLGDYVTIGLIVTVLTTAWALLFWSLVHWASVGMWYLYHAGG